MISPRELFDALFPGGKALYYGGTFNGQPFTKLWTVPGPAVEGGHQIDFFLELDPKQIGQGGSIIRERCRLALSPTLEPVRYGSEAQGAKLMLQVEGAKMKAIIADGTALETERGGAEFIVEANITALDALVFAIAHGNGRLKQEASFTLYLVNQLMAIPYKLTPLGGNKFRSSYEEEIELDDRGVLVRSYITKANVVFERQEAPPLPAWHNETGATIPKDLARYRKPKTATFELEDVSISSKNVPLGGSLTIPAGKGPFPAVLFLSGTGTHDRHGIAGEMDLGSHEILDDLAEHGVLGLRFDTRGAGTTKKADAALTSSLVPLIDDAKAWLSYLRGRPEVDPARVFLMGHSQGGTVALVLGADADPPVAGIALLAAPGRTLHELLEEQIVDQARKLNLPPEPTQKQVADFREFIAAIKAGKRFEAGEVPDHLMAFARLTDWIKEHMALAPTDLIARVRAPILICQGQKDFQVQPRDAEILYDAAKAAGKQVERALFPNLDHLFKSVEGESKLEQYYDRARHVDGALLERVRSWFRASN